ncbi:translocation/assembly module TamB domain-containing protein [Devosia sp. XJ19-1]|uniref:Translocation/assembly module TamB domain-containing protein n=1 Tax=Devosia ureilytica TaxID=2952754 RepID=A0A9Q4AQ63_9HYPH|nr:translocation/assembly module TamB domain-containing protein [Devosia ureilytica]MCP8884064.1 translocation/assembly module TamB domain-containing protein [Devosia ureilytica]MCP8887672.1 translocation/assembly module TamB domain-containing protein [Devosia ureilytica]
MARFINISRRRLFIAALLLAPAAVPVALVAQDLNNEEQKDFLTNFVQDRLSSPERQIRLSNIDGVLGSDVSIREITISDAEGVWLRVNNASLNWNQAALFGGRLEVNSLKADSIEYVRNAIPVEGAVDLPPPEAGGLEIPEFPVAIQIGELAVPSVTFGEGVFGLGSEIALAGSMTLEGGNLDAVLDIERLDGPGGTLDLDVAYRRQGNSIDLGLSLIEPPNGVLANLLNIEGRPAMELTLDGEGPVSDLTAQMRLLANEREALAGTATIAQSADGFAVTANLGGPLSTLVAEPYREFFGEDTRLTASALVRSAGGFDISSLTLSGGQLGLSARAQTTPDNFLSLLDLTATVADPEGGQVTLPVPGSATLVQGGQLQIAFGTEASEAWQARLDVEGFETDGFAARTFGLGIGGVARNLADPASRMVTFNGDGALSGIDADPGVEAALGDSVGLGIAGLWNAGEPIELAELRVVGQALVAGLSGQIDGTEFDGRIQIETDSIAPFSAMAGRSLSGALNLVADGKVMPVSGGFDLMFDGTGTNLAVDDATADALLEGTVNLSGRLARTEAGITAENFAITNPQVQFSADGVYASETADFDIALDLSDLGLISDEASGALAVRGSARLTSAEDPLVLVLDGQVPNGQLGQYGLRDAKLGVAATLLDGTVSGDVTGTAMLDGHRAALTTQFKTDDVQQSLSGISFEIAGTRVSGGLTRMAETGLVDGRLDVTANDVSLAAALLLTDASGAVNAAIELTPQDGEQGAGITANVANLRINDIAVGRADISAGISDLFGVPVVNGTATASDVVASGIVVDTLDARASQNGKTTSFDVQAALATGTDVDIAGALSPIAEGYRLALDRANLVQGSLSARLANPTALVVRGNSVALDALRFNVGSGSITATGTAGTALDMVVDISDLPLSIANAVAPDLGLSGTVNGRAMVSGEASDPQVSFEVRAGGIGASAIASFGIAPLTLSANGSYAASVVSLQNLTASGSGGLSVSGSGQLPLAGNGVALTLSGSAPLSLANQFVADRGAQLSGTANFNARIGGSLSSPQFSGSVSTSGAGYVDPALNLRLAGIAGRATLTGTSANVESLTANLATGGSVSASGTVGLTGGMPANLSVQINSARYADGELFVATLSGGLNLTGNLTGAPVLSGSVLVEEANITVPEGLGGGAELINVEHLRTPADVQRTLDRAKINERTGVAAGTGGPQMQLDVTVNAPNQIFIRGRGLDAEVGGSVRITGPINAVQPVGAFNLIRGRLSILGQRVIFETGTVTLVGDLDPQLNFVARTEGDGITVFVTLSGRASAPDISFSSNPTLPQDEVLSRLIFNRSMGELSPLQLAQLAAAAAELVGGGGGGGLVDSLRGAAGLADLDVVTDGQGNVGVQAGTYIQDNVYLGATVGSNGQSKVTINLDVTEDLTVKGSAGQNGDTSLGVFYERDY